MSYGSIYQSYGSSLNDRYNTITMHSSRYGKSSYVKNYGTGSHSPSSNYNYGSSSSRGSSYVSHSPVTHTTTSYNRNIPKGNTSSTASRFESGLYNSSTTHTETRKPPSGKSRPLPPRPEKDSRGRVVPPLSNYDTSTESFRTRKTTSQSSTHGSPIKATHDYDAKRYSDNHSRTPTPSRFSLTNTNSHALRTNSPSLHKKYGSTGSLSRGSVIENEFDINRTGRLSPSTRKTDSQSNKGLPYISQNGSIHNEVTDRTSRRDSHASERSVSPLVRRTSSATKRSPSLGTIGSRDSVDRILNSDHDAKSHSRKSSEESDYANNNKGLMGLRNLGNTCYMNCMLQGLSNTRELRQYLCDGQWRGDVNRNSRMKGKLIEAFAALIKKMWGSSSGGYSSSVSPTEFRSELTRYARRFSGYGQQDAQEFLIFLIEGLHEDVNRVQKKVPKQMLSDEFDKCSAEEKAMESWKWYTSYDDSFMVDLFVGQLRSSLECLQCGYVSNTFDPFWEIPLPLKKKKYGIGSEVRLSDCFDEFTREETLDGDERPTCEKCKKRQRCKKKFSIWKFPKILILHLKRFDPMSSYPTKLGTHVEFPISNLNLAQYADNKQAKSDCTYDLYSVSNHSGTARGGHYTAYTRHPYSKQWHHFNDQSCTSHSERNIVSAQAYVLFYERQSSRKSNL